MGCAKLLFVPRLVSSPTDETRVLCYCESGQGRGFLGHNAFCEVKLRSIAQGKVQGDHSQSQKQTTTVWKEKCDPVWNEEFAFRVGGEDAIRISIFSKGMIQKNYLGKVDLIMPELLQKLSTGSVTGTHPLTLAEGKSGKASGELELSICPVGPRDGQWFWEFGATPPEPRAYVLDELEA